MYLRGHPYGTSETIPRRCARVIEYDMLKGGIIGGESDVSSDSSSSIEIDVYSDSSSESEHFRYFSLSGEKPAVKRKSLEIHKF